MMPPADRWEAFTLEELRGLEALFRYGLFTSTECNSAVNHRLGSEIESAIARQSSAELPPSWERKVL